MVVAKLVEQSLPPPKNLVSNSTFGNFYKEPFIYCQLLKNKDKRPGKGHLKGFHKFKRTLAT